jgi:hypothetical protein
VKPDHAAALYNLGFLRQTQQRMSECMALYERAYEVDPGRPQIRAALSQFSASRYASDFVQGNSSEDPVAERVAAEKRWREPRDMSQIPSDKESSRSNKEFSTRSTKSNTTGTRGNLTMRNASVTADRSNESHAHAPAAGLVLEAKADMEQMQAAQRRSGFKEDPCTEAQQREAEERDSGHTEAVSRRQEKAFELERIMEEARQEAVEREAKTWDRSRDAGGAAAAGNAADAAMARGNGLREAERMARGMCGGEEKERGRAMSAAAPAEERKMMQKKEREEREAEEREEERLRWKGGWFPTQMPTPQEQRGSQVGVGNGFDVCGAGGETAGRETLPDNIDVMLEVTKPKIKAQLFRLSFHGIC